MSFKCTYCDKIFFNKYTLQNHINTAKYCIKLRDNFNKNIKEYICKYCNKNLTSQQNLDNHNNKCNIKKENEKEEKLNLKNNKHFMKINLKNSNYFMKTK